MHVLYATDGSEQALAGAHLLARLPLDSDCQLTLLTVLPGAEAADRDVEASFEPACHALRHTLAAMRRESRWGFADEEILSAAEVHAADLVVLGSRGLSGLRRLLIGSVAESVVRQARCPVLVARPLTNDLQTVVLGIDGSNGAMHAAARLKGFPLPEECALRLVTLIPRLEMIFPFGGTPWLVEPQTFSTEECENVQRRLDALVTTFTLVGKNCTAHLKLGDPAEGLLQDAEEAKADLIAVGSRGLSTTQRFLLGSVSERVLRYAGCSVLVVK